MTILVDMDDTIEELLEAWLKRVNAKYDRHVKKEEVLDWDVSKAYPGLTWHQVYDIMLDNDVWKEVDPIPGAAEALQRFQARGHKVYLVTASPYQTIPGKVDDMLRRCFPFIDLRDVIFTFHKQLIKADVLIDDGVHNLEGGDYVKILVDAPYNRSYNAEANGMIRVHSWDEIEQVILDLEKKMEEGKKEEI